MSAWEIYDSRISLKEVAKMTEYLKLKGQAIPIT